MSALFMLALVLLFMAISGVWEVMNVHLRVDLCCFVLGEILTLSL